MAESRGRLFHVKLLALGRARRARPLNRVIDPNERATENISRPSLERLAASPLLFQLMRQSHRGEKDGVWCGGTPDRHYLANLRVHRRCQSLKLRFR
jgi:hypothetical protein